MSGKLKITPEQSAFYMKAPPKVTPQLSEYEKLILDATAGAMDAYSGAQYSPRGTTVASVPIGRGNLDFKSTGISGLVPRYDQSYHGAQFTYPLGKKRSAFIPGG